MSAQLVAECGHITGVESSGQFYLTDAGVPLVAFAIVWLIRDGSEIVVVDAGPGSPTLVSEHFGRELVQPDVQHLHAQLHANGIGPDEVTKVVLTHLHWDHCLGLLEDPFPNATLVVQRDELAYAAAPYRPHRRLYSPAVVRLLVPPTGRTWVLDGDARLTPSVELLKTPGHTPGTQAVVMTTESRRYVLASDSVPFARTMDGPSPANWLPPGVHTSLDHWYRSATRLAAAGDVVIPSHDPAVLGKTYQ